VGGQVGRLGGTVGGRKLEKRAEHDDGARSSTCIHVKTRETKIKAYLFNDLFTKKSHNLTSAEGVH
jgi:hypothetical protein